MIHQEDKNVQEFVYQIEAGWLKPLILRFLFFAAVAALAAVYFLVIFRGLDSETAMDQAQIGRQIAAGSGYTTLYARPLAMWQFLNHQEAIPPSPLPETYNFPLNPAVNAVLLRPIKRWWPMQPNDLVYIGDTVIAAAGILLFLGSVLITFYLVRGLFDSRIAWLTVGLIFVTDLLWRFSISGLPQMLLLFLFSAALWLVHRAMMAREDKLTGRTLLWLAGAALFFGLMALAQPLTLWMSLGFLVFVFAWFRLRAISGLLVLFVLAAVVAPWLVRNYLVCGNPFGLAIFSILDGAGSSEFSFMSNLQPDLSAFGAVRAKLRGGLLDQFQNLFSYIGYNVAAAAFFLSLLHIFRQRVTNFFRWALLLMWLFAACGMAAFTPRGEVSHNQIHVLFVPLFIAYGLAFLIVLWNRMDLRFAPARIAFLAAIFLASALPMAVNILTAPPGRVAWPPYVAPIIHTVANWMDPNEVLCSDMPWATAWYGGRQSLLLPATVQQFIAIHDYEYLGGPVNGLYLTPVSGNRPFISQIAKGDYGSWGTFIMRTADLSRFPLQYFTPLPIDNECVFYSNRDRWSKRP
jgi:4-amino-4-deoxy-L-arabinose transferase-like glycosyltransferase